MVVQHISYRLWYSDDAPVDERLNTGRICRRIENIISRYLGKVPVGQFVEAASLDHRNRYVGIFSKAFCNRQARSAASHNLS